MYHTYINMLFVQLYYKRYSISRCCSVGLKAPAQRAAMAAREAAAREPSVLVMRRPRRAAAGVAQLFRAYAQFPTR